MTKRSTMLTRAFWAGAAFFLVAAAGPAAAGVRDDVRDLQERMNRAEQSLAGQGAATVRISELEREIQMLTGRIEELTFQLDQANMRLDAISAALAGEGAGAAGSEAGLSFGAPGAAPVASGGPVNLTAGDPIADEISRSQEPAASNSFAGDVTLPLDPNAAFNYASQFLLQGDYPRAKEAFELYVEAFPNHSRTADAQFRLGDIHLALGDNAAAADAFIAHIRNYPNDPRAAEAYLKLGTAFSRLERPDEACTVFKTLKTKFPGAAGPVMQRADTEMARIDCQ